MLRPTLRPALCGRKLQPLNLPAGLCTRRTGGALQLEIESRAEDPATVPSHGPVHAAVCPAHFVSSLDVRFQGEPVLSVELNFSISENPHFRFYFVPGAQGLLEARVTDTQDRVFRSALDLEEQLLRRPSP
jgi:hypothetical protein